MPRDVFEDADFRKFFLEGNLLHVLDAITLIWQWHDSTQFDPNSMPDETAAHMSLRDSWHRFVGEVFREENLAYRLDEECGVHFLVDAEFAAQGNNLIRLLEQSRYESCRAEVTRCLKAIDASPADTKVAVNAAFAAVEILFKKISGTEGLNAGRVKSHLLPVVQDVAPNDLAAQTSTKHLIDSFAGWVSASHFYRHAQADDVVVDPNIDAAVLLISQGWSWLRYLLGLDTAQTEIQKGGDTPKSF